MTPVPLFRKQRSKGLEAMMTREIPPVCRLAIRWGAALLIAAVPVRALDAAEVDGLTRTLSATKVIEVPAAIAHAIAGASGKDRAEVATVAVVAAVKAYPAAVGPCVLAAVRSAPEAAEAIVSAALDASPASVLALVSIAAESGADGERIIGLAERRFPGRAAALEREVAVVRSQAAGVVPVPGGASAPPRSKGTPTTPPLSVSPAAGEAARP